MFDFEILLHVLVHAYKIYFDETTLSRTNYSSDTALLHKKIIFSRLFQKSLSICSDCIGEGNAVVKDSCWLCKGQLLIWNTIYSQ